MDQQNEILKELKELESPLAGLTRDMPYTVPEGYLAGLPEALSRSAAARHTSPFVVPEGYFGALPGRLLQAATAAEQPKARSIAFGPGWRRSALQWAAAAMLVLAAGAGAYRFVQPAPIAPETAINRQLAGLESDSIEVYLDQQVDELDAESLEAALASAQTEMPLTIEDLDEREIQQYLGEDAGIENLN